MPVSKSNTENNERKAIGHISSDEFHYVLLNLKKKRNRTMKFPKSFKQIMNQQGDNHGFGLKEL